MVLLRSGLHAVELSGLEEGQMRGAKGGSPALVGDVIRAACFYAFGI